MKDSQRLQEMMIMDAMSLRMQTIADTVYAGLPAEVVAFCQRSAFVAPDSAHAGPLVPASVSASSAPTFN